MTSPWTAPRTVDGTSAGVRRPGGVPVALLFGLFGFVSGSWAGRIPWISDALDLSPGELGIALFAPAVAAVATLPVAGGLTARLGSRTAATLTVAAFGLLSALPAFSPNLPTLCLTLAGYGAAGAALDVAVNAAGVEVERRAPRSRMSGLHAMWSGGALVGAAGAGLAAGAGVGAPVHLAVVGAVTTVAGLVTARRLVPGPATVPGGRTFALPGRGLLALGMIGFCSFFAEAAVADWSAVFLVGWRGTSEAVAASGFAVYSVCMVAGRLAGDRLVDRWGRVRVVVVSATAAAAGLLVVVSVPSLAAAWVGFALAGLGLATVVPLAFSAAGHHHGEPPRPRRRRPGPDHASQPDYQRRPVDLPSGAPPAGDVDDQSRTATSIAAVATLSYLGWLTGPPVIGGVATLTSLPVALGVTAALVGAVALLADALR